MTTHDYDTTEGAAALVLDALDGDEAAMSHLRFVEVCDGIPHHDVAMHTLAVLAGVDGLSLANMPEWIDPLIVELTLEGLCHRAVRA